MVVDRGDIIITPFKKYVDDPVRITIEQGLISGVSGGFDAELLRDYIAGFDDPKARGIAHIGWGYNEKARWSGLQNDRRSIGMESRCFTATSSSRPGPTRGSAGNDTSCHIDIPMRSCSLFLDDEPILIDGEFAIDDLKAQRPGLVAA